MIGALLPEERFAKRRGVTRRLAKALASIPFLLALAPGCGGKAPAVSPDNPTEKPIDVTRGLGKIEADARALSPLVHSDLARRFLAAAKALPKIAPRMLHRDASTKRVVGAAAWANLEDREGFLNFPVDEEFFYNTKYGSPLAYARALDVLADAGATLAAGSAFFDFGYGGIGHLRLLASLGVRAVGVDVDPVLAALYAEPGDQGPIPGIEGPAGSLRLVHGSFPGDEAVAAQVSGPFDVIVSKNVLKKGYIHPDRPADEKFLIKLGVSDEVFLSAVAQRLRPGGFFLIYNICPAPSPPDKPFLPWSDGRSPFSREAFEAAGFSVRIFDRDDTEAIRKMGHALGWDRGEDAMDLEHDLSVIFTLVEKRGG